MDLVITLNIFQIYFKYKRQLKFEQIVSAQNFTLIHFNTDTFVKLRALFLQFAINSIDLRYHPSVGYWLEDPFDMLHKLRAWYSRKWTCFLK